MSSVHQNSSHTHARTDSVAGENMGTTQAHRYIAKTQHGLTKYLANQNRSSQHASHTSKHRSWKCCLPTETTPARRPTSGESARHAASGAGASGDVSSRDSAALATLLGNTVPGGSSAVGESQHCPQRNQWEKQHRPSGGRIPTAQ